MDFFAHLQNELQPKIDQILDHPFLNRLADGSLSKEQLKFFTLQYSIYCAYFPRFLAAAAANVPDDRTRMPIMENLWEEHGEGKIAASHRVLYENYAKGLGLSQADLMSASPLPNTRACVENLLDLCEEGHFLESLGALGPGTEFFTTAEYLKILEGLRKHKILTEEHLEFWIVHTALDEEHYSEMIDALRPWAKTSTEESMIRLGAIKAIELEILFWDGLEKYLPGK
ncbi:MAG: iron-containing redox enzyme family protein [Chitinophagales bacterium]